MLRSSEPHVPNPKIPSRPPHLVLQEKLVTGTVCRTSSWQKPENFQESLKVYRVSSGLLTLRKRLSFLLCKSCKQTRNELRWCQLDLEVSNFSVLYRIRKGNRFSTNRWVRLVFFFRKSIIRWRRILPRPVSNMNAHFNPAWCRSESPRLPLKISSKGFYSLSLMLSNERVTIEPTTIMLSTKVVSSMSISSLSDSVVL